ncbi:N-acetylglucosamine kinase [Halobacillus sp. Marseille-Q1614]|uniref:N-acetylglucosamine kinase n=1 Tax=Halobacillus sp. Marseille-Q1614 TaxID=2709134 RepID=UPI001570D9C0|nr:BadF/BadG/BcrA/BcrD ATPase family protein [Halobacillus sp. Marseille-Q1614]
MIIGIDAGGTSTKGALMNLKGEVVFTCESGFGNPLIDRVIAWGNIKETVQTCMDASSERIEHITIGMAGYNTVKNGLDFPADWTAKVTLMTDAELALEAAVPSGNGILTIAGTGSVHVGKAGEITYIAGGWGHLLGDEGGGYSIGKLSIQHVLADLESVNDPSVFSLKILHLIHQHDISGVKNWFYNQSKTEIAGLAAHVLQLAEKDTDAYRLINQEAKDLAEQVDRFYKKISLDSTAVLVVSGSILKKSELFFSRFQHYIESPFLKIERMIVPAYMGAYHYFVKAK